MRVKWKKGRPRTYGTYYGVLNGVPIRVRLCTGGKGPRVKWKVWLVRMPGDHRVVAYRQDWRGGLKAALRAMYEMLHRVELLYAGGPP